MHQLELEGIAQAVLEHGGQDGEEAPRLGRLVTVHLGEDSVAYAPFRLPGDGALVCIGDKWRIYVRRKLPIERRAFAIAHELAEWWLRMRERYTGADVEHAANYIAAAIIAPRRAFISALREHGHGFTILAEAFRTTETHVALREAEILRLPRAVISPSLVRVRGPEAWVWPQESIVRRWAKSGGPGVKRVKLSDPGRFVVDADDPDAASG